MLSASCRLSSPTAGSKRASPTISDIATLISARKFAYARKLAIAPAEGRQRRGQRFLGDRCHCRIGESATRVARARQLPLGASMRRTVPILTVSVALLGTGTSHAQAPAGRDSVMSRIPIEAQERSQLYPLAQTLMDSIGPRLMGSIEQRRANDWVLSMYRKWGIPARSERYGTWNEWRREIAHIDLIAPRKRPLEGILSTWSPGTKGTVQAAVVVH